MNAQQSSGIKQELVFSETYVIMVDLLMVIVCSVTA